MTKEQIKKLQYAMDRGFYILIDNFFLDTFVENIFKNSKGKLCYSSNVFNEVSLEEISIRKVRVFREITDELNMMEE